MGSASAAGHDAMMRHIPVTPVLLLIDSDANLDIPLSEHQTCTYSIRILRVGGWPMMIPIYSCVSDEPACRR